jgi:hypothetical protein
MKASIRRAAGLALCLVMTAGLLGGCARLLERSYGITEPYADRYWDSSAEDTLRAETYQDLVNSLLLLVEQKAEEGVIRCYGEAEEYEQVLAARREVRQETMLGSYLLKELQLDHEKGSGYSTVTCQMTYREDAEDLGALMPISDSQSLVDLLRLAVREDYEKLAAHFTYEPSREDVAAAVESLWQEICRSEMEELAALSVDEEVPEEGVPEGEEGVVPEESGEGGAEAPPEEQEDMPPEEEAVDGEAVEGEDGEAVEPPPEEPVIEYPPCPWSIRFYPNQETAEIVEVLLKP